MHGAGGRRGHVLAVTMDRRTRAAGGSRVVGHHRCAVTMGPPERRRAAVSSAIQRRARRRPWALAVAETGARSLSAHVQPRASVAQRRGLGTARGTGDGRLLRRATRIDVDLTAPPADGRCVQRRTQEPAARTAPWTAPRSLRSMGRVRTVGSRAGGSDSGRPLNTASSCLRQQPARATSRAASTRTRTGAGGSRTQRVVQHRARAPP